jgi:AcrR family transcriptional regulator
MARPRAFDLDIATDAALHLFWQKGYGGTSLADLTEAMGINRPSFYAAFGSKEALFHRVIERYIEGPGANISAALQEKSAREVVASMLAGYADAPGDPLRPKGCLLVQGALACSAEEQGIRDELAACRAAGERALRDRLKRAKAEGDLANDENPADLARYVWTVCQGMAVQAAGGATRAELRRVADQVMKSFPDRSRSTRRS